MDDSDSKNQQTYWAFISYSSLDKKWGAWLHKKLENYPIPKEFRDVKIFDGAVLGKNLRPIFRDRDELSGSADLGPAIMIALEKSRFLIVLCSPNSAQSKWVNKEIEDFRALDPENNKRILALILDGEPNATTNVKVDSSLECFPPALQYPSEPLAGDLRKEGDGKERGFLKLLSGISQIRFDELYKRHERAQRKKRLAIAVTSSVIIFALSGLSIFSFQQKAHAEKNQAEATKQRDIAKQKEAEALKNLANSYIQRGRQLYLEGNHAEALALLNEARKMVPEVTGIDTLLSDIWLKLSLQTSHLRGDNEAVSQMHFSPDGSKIAVQNPHSETRVYNLSTTELIHQSSGFRSHMKHSLLNAKPCILADFRQTTSTENSDYITNSIHKLDWHQRRSLAHINWPIKWGKPDFMHLSSSGRYLLAAPYLHCEDSNNVVLYDFKTEIPSQRIISLKEIPANSTWSFVDNDRFLVEYKQTADNNHFIRFRDIKTGEIIREDALKGIPVASASRGDRFCLGLYDGTLIEYICKNHPTPRTSPKDTVRQIESISYSNDGKTLLATGTFGKSIHYRTEDWVSLWKTPRSSINGVVRHGTLSPDGKLAAFAHSNRVTVFNLSENRIIAQHSWQGKDASRVAFSYDNQSLAAASTAGHIRIWKLEEKPPQLAQVHIPAEDILNKLTHISADEYFVQGYHIHTLNTKTRKSEKLKFNGMVNISTSKQHLVAHGGIILDVSIENTQTKKQLKSTRMLKATNLFLPKTSPVAGVIIEQHGRIRPYSSEPKFLTNEYKPQEKHGRVISTALNEEANSLASTYTDGTILISNIDGKGITQTTVHPIDGAQISPPLIKEYHKGYLTLSINSIFYLYNLDSRELQKIPRRGIRAIKLIETEEDIHIMTIETFGIVELWDLQCQIISRTVSPHTKNEDKAAYGAKRITGKNILLHPHHSTAYTTFGNQIFIWSLPELTLQWRSPKILYTGLMSDLLTLQNLSSDQKTIILTDTALSEDTFKSIHLVTPPTYIPSQREVDAYLEKIAGIEIIDGRIIQR